MDLPQPLIPDELKHRVLVLQLPQLRQRRVGVHAVGQHQLIGQHRLQKRLLRLRRRAEGLSRTGVRQAGDGGDHARRQRLRGRKLLAGVQPQLVDLLLIGLAVHRVFQRRLGTQRAAGDAQPRQPCALRVAADLEHPRAESAAVLGSGRVSRQRVEKRIHAVQLQSGAEEHGKQLAPTNERGERRIVKRAVLQKSLQRRFVAQGGVFVAVGRGKVDAAGQRLRELRHQRGAVCAREVELVDKHERRHAVALQQPQQRPRVALYAVGAADDENGAVQHGERSLHLSGEVHMPRRVQKGKACALHRKQRGFPKDRDAALPFQSVGVEEGVAVVDAPQRAPRARGIEQRLGQGGFARVHMREDADHGVALHGFASLRKSHGIYYRISSRAFQPEIRCCRTRETVIKLSQLAGMAELADVQDLGSCGVIRVGSSPTTRTTMRGHLGEQGTVRSRVKCPR